MDHRLRTVAMVLAVALLASGPVLAQSQSQSAANAETDWEMPRLADGQPDLQGYWTTQTFTPMQRPEYLGDQAFYTEEEFAQLQAQLTVDGADPLARFVIDIPDAAELRAGSRPEPPRRVLRPLRQRHLARHPGAEGVVDPAHLADHRPAKWPHPCPQRAGPGAGGGAPRGAR